MKITRRLINLLMLLSLLFHHAAIPQTASRAGEQTPSAPEEKIWNTVTMNGIDYDIYLITRDGKSDPSLWTGRALYPLVDQNVIHWMYVKQNGVLVADDLAQEIIYLAQQIASIHDFPQAKKQPAYYLADEFVGCANHIPDKFWYLFPPLSTDPYYLCIPKNHSNQFYNNYLYWNWIGFPGLDIENDRAGIYAQILLDAALQPEFNNPETRKAIYGTELENLLNSQHLSDSMTAFRSKQTKSITLLDYSNFLAGLTDKAGSILEAAKQKMAIDSTFTSLASASLSISQDVFEYWLLVSYANHASDERLKALEDFIDQNKLILDPAWLTASAIARQDFNKLMNDYYNANNGDFIKGLARVAMNKPVGYIVTVAQITAAMEQLILVKMGQAALAKKLGIYALIIFTSWEIYQDQFEFDQTVKLSAAAPTLQRLLFSPALTQVNLFELADQAKLGTQINATKAVNVVNLYQINWYLSWKHLDGVMRTYNHESKLTNLAPQEGVTWAFATIQEKKTFINRVKEQRDQTGFVFAKAYIDLVDPIYPAGLFRLNRQLTLADAGAAPEIRIISPLFPGEYVNGVFVFDFDILARAAAQNVTITIKNQNDLTMATTQIPSPPFKFEVDTGGWAPGRYTAEMHAQTYTGAAPDGKSPAVSTQLYETTWVQVEPTPANKAPQINLLTPKNHVGYESFKIEWEDQDEDDNALINLYYDTDASGFDGVWITGYLQEDWASNSYVWRIPDTLPAGSYWIYAEISDGVNPVQRAYSPGPLQVLTPLEADNFTITAVNVVEEVGDGDGVLDLGEGFAYDLAIQNQSAQNLQKVKASLIDNLPDVLITDDDVKFYDVAAGATQDAKGDFNFTAPVSANPDQEFTIRITYSDPGGIPYYDLETVRVQLASNDVTPPVITWGPTVSEIQPDSALISWGTDEPAGSVVLYGSTPGLGRMEDRREFTTTHRVTIRGLAPGLLHYFTVQSSDPSGNGPAEAAGMLTTLNVGNGIHLLTADYPALFYVFGLAWDNTRNALWVLHRNDQLQYFLSRYDPAGRLVQVTYPVDFMPAMNNSARGLAFDGANLWMADISDELIYKINPASGDLIRSFAWPGADPRGLAWDGANLWVADSGTLQICRTNASIQPVSCFASPGISPIGLAWDGSALWNSDSDSKLLYRLSATGARLQTVQMSGKLPYALTFAGANLWVGIDAPLNDYIILTNLQDDLISPVIEGAPAAAAENGTSVIVTWQTDEVSTSIVQQYNGACNGTGAELAGDSQYTASHRVVVNHLSPGSTLDYCVGSQDFANNLVTWAGPYQVTTPAVTNLNILDVVWGYDEGDRGLTFEGSAMWTIDNKMMYKIDPATGRQTGYIKLPTTVSPEGLTYDGSGLWYYDDTNIRLIKVNPSTGSQMANIPAPDKAIQDLAFDGTYLWVVDKSNDRVYRVNRSNGAVVSSFVSTLTYMRGIAVDSANSLLWIYNSDTQMIYKTNYSGTILGSYPSYGANTNSIEWKDGALWVMSNQWRYKIDTGSTNAPVIATVTVGGIPWAINRIGQLVNIDVQEQFGRSGFQGSLTITSATDDPAIVNVPLVDLGGGHYQYTWNTAGRLGAFDYQVEARLTDGTRADPDGLEGVDLTLMLGPGLTTERNLAVNGPTLITGVGWTGSDLWVSQSNTWPGYLHRVDWNTGNIFSTCTAAMEPVSPNLSDPNGMVWDGAQFWVANDFANTADELTRHNTGCTITARITFPGNDPSGITWDGTYLYVSDIDSNLIYKMTTAGAVIAQIPSPVPVPIGLAWENGRLWVADIMQGLFEVNPVSGEIVNAFALDSSPKNLTWSGGNFYITTDHSVRKLTIQTDLAIAPLAGTAQVEEGVTAQITATVHDYGLGAGIVQLGWYVGQPDSGGTLLQPVSELGAVNPGSPAVNSLNWSSLTAGRYEICAKIDPAGVLVEADEANNTSCFLIDVVDTDVDPPAVTGLTLTAPNGDGDAFLEDDEQILFAWQAQDASGIGSARVVVDGVEHAASVVSPGNLQALAGPFPAGAHTCALYTTDADNSPETAVTDCAFSIFSANPNVTGVYPAPDATGVRVNVEMNASFQEEMRLEQHSADALSFEVRNSAGIPAFGSLSLGASNEDVVFLPAAALDVSQVYTMTIFAADSVVDENGNLMAGDYSWVFTTEADSLAPEIQVSYPLAGQEVNGFVDVRGLVYDSALASYRVEVGAGAAPGSWSLVWEDYGNVIHGPLGAWDTSGLANGLYTLRVTAVDIAGHATQVEVALTLNRPLPLPQISSVYPPGVLVGYQNAYLDINGVNFKPAAQVTVGGLPAPEVVWVNPAWLIVKVPGGLQEGQYPLVVDNGGGQVVTWAGWFEVWALTKFDIFLPFMRR